MRSWRVLLCVCLSIAAVQGGEAQRTPRLLHLQGSVLLLGYPEVDTLFVTRDGEELTLQPPGPGRVGHHTYPSLSRDGTLVATSYVKSPHPRYREGIATYSLADRQWKTYDAGDSVRVWAVTISPDGSTLAFKAERERERMGPRPLLSLLDLKTGDMTVLIEPFHATAPLSWSSDGRYFAYEHWVNQPDPNVYSGDHEIRIRDLRNQQERRLATGSDPAWSPSGTWIAYLNGGAVVLVQPDGAGATAPVKLRRSLPWFNRRRFMHPPVWSSDSTALLLNEAADDETVRALIHQFDLEPQTLRKKKGTGVAVLGWAPLTSRPISSRLYD